MKIRQSIHHFATKKAPTIPVIGDIAAEKMVDLHVHIFNGRADPDRQGEREDHMATFFECTFDTYLAALDAGFPEVETRGITHVQADSDFYNHGWTEMIGIPVGEIEARYERYEEFFERHSIDITEPFGEFCTIDILDTSTTLDKLNDLDHPHAEDDFADDMYVEDDSGEVGIDGANESEDVGVSAAPGMQDVNRTGERIA